MPKTAAAKTSTRASRARVEQPVAVPRPAGSVAFVGTGPGDPGLLTVRATELIAAADVVITEAPEHESLLQSLLGTRFDEVTVVDGGYGEDGQPLTHASRAKLVVKHSKGDANVVRLISGDPWMYATGAEEAAACAKASISFEIVPGRQLGDGGARVRRRAADHPDLARGHRAQHRRDEDRLVPLRRRADAGAARRPGRAWPTSPRRWSPPAVTRTLRSR